MNTAKQAKLEGLSRGSEIRQITPSQEQETGELKLISEFPHMSHTVQRAVRKAVNEARENLMGIVYNAEGQGIALVDANDDPIVIPRDIADAFIWDVQAKMDQEDRNVRLEKTKDAIHILMGDEK